MTYAHKKFHYRFGFELLDDKHSLTAALHSLFIESFRYPLACVKKGNLGSYMSHHDVK